MSDAGGSRTAVALCVVTLVTFLVLRRRIAQLERIVARPMDALARRVNEATRFEAIMERAGPNLRAVPSTRSRSRPGRTSVAGTR